MQTRINTVVARYLKLDPKSVCVPVIGGSDYNCVVPLISMTQPQHLLSEDQTKDIYKLIFDDNYECQKCMEYDTKNFLSDGYAIANFVKTVAKGMCGEGHCVAPTLMKTNNFDLLQ